MRPYAAAPYALYEYAQPLCFVLDIKCGCLQTRRTNQVDTSTLCFVVGFVLGFKGDKRVHWIYSRQVEPLITVWCTATCPLTRCRQDGQKHREVIHCILAPHTIVGTTAKRQKVALVGDVLLAFG